MPSRSSLSSLGLQLLTILLVFVCWELVGRGGFFPPRLFPPPSEVLPAIVEMARSGELAEDLLASAQRWFAGFFLGGCFGIAFGVLTGRILWLRASLGSLLNALSSIPKVVLIPVAILWFGIGETQKVLLVAWGTIFPIWLSTQEGTSRIEQEYLWAARSLGLRRLGLVRHVLIPNSFPYIATGLRIAIANATFSLAAAEMAGAFSGLAHRVFYSHQMFQTQKMFAGVVLITAFSWVLNGIFSLAVRRIAPWLRQEGAA